MRVEKSMSSLGLEYDVFKATLHINNRIATGYGSSFIEAITKVLENSKLINNEL